MTRLLGFFAIGVLGAACGSTEAAPPLGSGRTSSPSTDPPSNICDRIAPPNRPLTSRVSPARTAALRQQLRDAILATDTLRAENLANQLGNDAAPVLTTLAAHPDVRIRELVLEVAAEVDTPNACSAAVQLFQDPELRGMAYHVATYCAGPEHLEPLLDALDAIPPDSEAAWEQSLIKAIAQVGGATQQPLLRRRFEQTREEPTRHALFLALAHLGEPQARTEFINLLSAEGANTRHGAMRMLLNDVADCELIAYLGPALDDERVIEVRAPSDNEVIRFRVRDVAVHTMHSMGLPFETPIQEGGFDDPGPEALEEAKRMVAAIRRQPRR